MKTLSLFLFLTIFILSSCTPAVVEQPTAAPVEPPTSTATLPATATEAPSPTPSPEPTSTPQPTATPVPPTATATATAIPPLAVIDHSFNAWCAPLEYAGTKPLSYEPPTYARTMTYAEELPVASIPGVYCVISFQFNQPVPAGVELHVMDSASTFIRTPLAAADGHPDVGWAVVNHPYVVNPPLWQITYQLAVVGPDGQELWSNPVEFAKPLPETCLFGGLPNPVTMYCAITDPLEIEPHPDAKYPYDRSRLTPDP